LVNYFPYNLEAPAPDSPHPFAVHVEVADCPWQPQHRLARIGIQGKKVGLEQRNSNFVFLIDVSGSMDQPDKLPLVKESLRLLVEQLDEKDRVSIVTYAGSSGLVLPPTNGDQKDRIRAAIANMTPGGSTHGSAGIQLAYEQAIAGFIPEGVNRVILCSDGDFNVGISSPSDLEKLITEKARSGVFLSVLGFGTGNLKDRTMETLADKGNGNYGYIDSLSEARKLLVEQMTGTLITIAKDVKIQVEFNPAQVASYRLIGYENRLLAKEDFNDDTKDAGEIGAGHSVTALYEIVPVGVTPATAPVDSLKYQTPPAAPAASPATPKSPELLTVKLRYKAPEGATSQLIEVPVTDKETTLVAATPEFKFTTAVAAYGLMLRQSTYRGPLTWDQIRQLALEGKGTDPHGYRAEFLQLLDKARSLLPSNQ
jgi:secreted protein with Ig-like and vWFA domain